MLQPLAGSETVCFRNPLCTVVYHSNGYIRLDWASVVPTGEQLQQVYNQALRALVRYSLRKLVSYHGQRRPIPLDQQHWIKTEWIPQVVETLGQVYCAVVDSLHPLTRLATQAVVSNSPQKMLFYHAASLAEADSWLNQQH